MKKAASLFLAALMALSLAACGGDADSTTKAPDSSGTPSGSKTTASKATTTAKPTTTSTEGGTQVDPPIDDITKVLVAPTAEYKYQVFECKYNANGAGGVYETDDLQAFMDTYNWSLGDAELPADAMTAINEFTDTAKGPFGDAINGNVYDVDGNLIENNLDVDWAGDNHGLICATTFEIENLEQFKKDYADVYMTFWYDNTPSVYINGKLVLYKNTELTGDPGDWVDNFLPLDPTDTAFEPLGDQTLMDMLIEGTNTVVIVMKDAWGGRECCFELDADKA